MSDHEPELHVEVTCRDTSHVGPCFERDCPFEARILIEATSPGVSASVFACTRHKPEGMLRALARYLDCASWVQRARQAARS